MHNILHHIPLSSNQTPPFFGVYANQKSSVFPELIASHFKYIIIPNAFRFRKWNLDSDVSTSMSLEYQ